MKIKVESESTLEEIFSYVSYWERYKRKRSCICVLFHPEACLRPADKFGGVSRVPPDRSILRQAGNPGAKNSRGHKEVGPEGDIAAIKTEAGIPGHRFWKINRNLSSSIDNHYHHFTRVVYPQPTGRSRTSLLHYLRGIRGHRKIGR